MEEDRNTSNNNTEEMEDIWDEEEYARLDEQFEKELYGTKEEKMNCDLEEIKDIPECLKKRGVTSGYHLVSGEDVLAYLYLEGHNCALFDTEFEDRIQSIEAFNSLAKYSNGAPIVTFSLEASSATGAIHYRASECDDIRKKSKVIQWLDDGWTRDEGK